MHTTVEGPVLWFRKNVVEAARTGEVGILWAQQRKPICVDQSRLFLYTVHLYYSLQQPVWYHRQFQRVTSIEDCDVSDMTCRYSMPSQYSNFFCWLKTSLLSVFSLAQVWSKPAISAWLGCWSWNAGPSQVGLDECWSYIPIHLLNIQHDKKQCATSGRGWMTASSMRRALVLPTCKLSRWIL